MYKNLLAEMARKGIINSQIAKAIGINPSTLSAKLNSYDRLKLCEAEKIKNTFFPGMSILTSIGGTNGKNRKDYQAKKETATGRHHVTPTIFSMYERHLQRSVKMLTDSGLKTQSNCITACSFTKQTGLIYQISEDGTLQSTCRKKPRGYSFV